MRIDVFSMTVGSNLTTLASPGLEIGCPATGFPKPVIQWYREGTPVKLGMMLNVDEGTGTLFILSISHRKGGTYTCVATNVLGSDSASSLITVLGMKIDIFLRFLPILWSYISYLLCFFVHLIGLSAITIIYQLLDVLSQLYGAHSKRCAYQKKRGLRGVLNMREKQILTSVIEIQKENWG